MTTSRLAVATDPAMALVVRIFVGSMTERWDVPEPVRDDLRLAASELFAGAVEAGYGDVVTFELSAEDGAIELLVAEAHAGNPTNGVPLEGRDGRFDLIRALFPDADIGESVRIRVPTG